jgi:hypothetical protein
VDATGEANKGVAICPRVPPERRAIVCAENNIGGVMPVAPSKKDKAVQEALFAAMGNATVVTDEHVNTAILNAFLVTGIAFRTVEDPFFAAMLQVAAKRGPHFRPMTTRNLSAVVDVDYARLLETTQARLDVDADAGLMLCLGGAKAKGEQPLINFVVQTVHGPVMLPTVDAKGQVKTAPYMCEVLSATLRAAGPASFIAICSDGAHNLRAGFDLVVNAPDLAHLAFLPCMTHAADLQLSKIGQLPWAADLIRVADVVCHFFRSRYMPCALLRAAARVANTPPTLIGRCDTRFATVFAMLHRLVRQEAVLKALILSQNWLTWRAGTY